MPRIKVTLEQREEAKRVLERALSPFHNVAELARKMGMSRLYLFFALGMTMRSDNLNHYQCPASAILKILAWDQKIS